MDVTQTVSLVGSAISATSGLLDVFKTASSLRGAQSEQVQAAKETVLQMKEALYVAKETIFAQKDQIAELRDRVKQLEAMTAQREQCSLQQLGPGAFAYISKEVQDAVKNGPWFCQPCFENGTRSVLQFSKHDWHYDLFECPRCKGAIHIPNGRTMEIRVAPRSNRFDGF